MGVRAQPEQTTKRRVMVAPFHSAADLLDLSIHPCFMAAVGQAVLEAASLAIGGERCKRQLSCAGLHDSAVLSNGPSFSAAASLAEKMSGPQLVHLELDEKDKEQLQELQQSMGQAQQEMSMLKAKHHMRETEKRRSDLTLHDLSSLPDDARAYKQVGKMFLMHPLPDLKCRPPARTAPRRPQPPQRTHPAPPRRRAGRA